MIELGLPEIGGGAADNVGAAGGHGGDERLGVARAPGSGRLLDGVEIGDKFRAVAQALPKISGRRLFGPLSGVVGAEELRIRSDDIAAHGRFLVP